MPNDFSMHDIPSEERPRERLFRHGAKALSAAELVAILLRTGTGKENVLRLAERILSENGGLAGLARIHPSELENVKGLGKAKIAQIVAAVEIGSRLASYPAEERPVIRSAGDAARLVMDMRHLDQEHIRIMLLDSQQRVIATPTVYIGTQNMSILRMSELFREAIVRNSPAVILVHNHPFGKADPSPEDITLTKDFVQAGHVLDIQVMDHLIVGERDWVSLREIGLGFD